MTSEATVTSRVPARWRFRYSIGTLLLTVLWIGLLLSVLLSQRQVYKERQAHRREFASLKESHQQAMKLIKSEHQRELHDIQLEKERMRLLAGFPDKSNPNRLSVGFNPSSSSPSGPWTFRIHQPSRRQLCLCYAVRDIPRNELPIPVNKIPLKASKSKEGQPAELVLFVRMVNGVGETPGTWKYQLLIAGDLRTSELIDIAPSHLLHPDHFATSSSVRIEYPGAPPGYSDVPHIILRHREVGPEPSNGLILWLEDAE